MTVGTARLFVFVAPLLCIASAQARTVANIALYNTVGCFAKTDLLDIMRAGNIGKDADLTKTGRRLLAVIDEKVKADKCFRVQPGDQALFSPEWQNVNDLWYGFSILEGANGRRFYGHPWDWKYLGEMPNFIRP